MFIDFPDRESWLDGRQDYLTASAATNYCGLNPYDQNGMLMLWEEKTGLRKSPDIGDRPSVRFGKEAEEHLRALFMLMHPEFECRYDQFGLWISDKHPFMAATLDGLLTHRDTGEVWIWECKTGTVHKASDFDDWRNGVIPINYWCQECHQMICVPQAKGVVTFAHIRKEWDPCESHLFTIWNTRQGNESDIAAIEEKAVSMWELIQTKTRPAVVMSL